jgi:DNA repair exonuclease SbcCD nuclease subunit
MIQLYSKEVKVGDFKVNSNITQEMIDDLKNFKSWEDVLRESEIQQKQEERREKLNKINKISDE